MRNRAFTLLEVVVAMSILAVSLVAVLDINASAVYSHVYAKKLTVATLLARSKMTDLEQKLYDEPLTADDEEDAGDFSAEGWPGFKWRAKVIVPKTNGLSPEQLFGALFNMPMGDGKDGAGGMLGSLFGGGAASGGVGAGAAAAAAQGGPGGAGGLMGALGPMAGMAQQQFTQMVDQLQKSVREVHLTVTWKEGKLTESIDLVTHVVSIGPGSDRNGGAAAASGAPNAASGGLVRQDGTAAVGTPRPAPNGVGWVDETGAALMPAGQNALANPTLNNLNLNGVRPFSPNAAGLIKR
ncbi:MAG: prepilin-type N-terminal cleavage/methylation domain-containing protein [Archangium sp.]|nr:prepilin-type N-terminal cleavage/methylation domain-containing protein [Archangium sp.]